MGEDSPSAKLARFREAFRATGYSAERFAQLTHRNTSTVEKWLKPDWDRNPQLTADDADVLRVQARWLLLGEGPRDLGDVAELAGEVADLNRSFAEMADLVRELHLRLASKGEDGGDGEPGSVAQDD